MAFEQLRHARRVAETLADEIEPALARVAANVQGEAQGGLTSAQWAKRAELAAKLLTPGGTQRYAQIAALTIASLRLDVSTPAAVIQAVQTIFDDLAGVTGADLAGA